jgi:hypothetical protein
MATGNNNITPSSIKILLTAPITLVEQATGTVQSGLAITNLVNFNKDISWERTFSTNLGLDLAMFKKPY